AGAEGVRLAGPPMALHDARPVGDDGGGHRRERGEEGRIAPVIEEDAEVDPLALDAPRDAPSSDPAATLDHHHRRARICEGARTSKPGYAGADDYGSIHDALPSTGAPSVSKGARPGRGRAHGTGKPIAPSIDVSAINGSPTMASWSADSMRSKSVTPRASIRYEPAQSSGASAAT